jgi:hypothetical protein
MMDQSFAETSTSTTPDCFLAVATSSGSRTVTIDAIASPEENDAITRAPSLCKNRASDGANLANRSRVASPSTTNVFEHPDSIAANTHAFEVVSIQNVFFSPSSSWSSSSFFFFFFVVVVVASATTFERRRKRLKRSTFTVVVVVLVVVVIALNRVSMMWDDGAQSREEEEEKTTTIFLSRFEIYKMPHTFF